MKPSFLISYNYRHIISHDIIQAYPFKIINLHCSLLPWNRGADPNFWSFVDNTPKGVTIHYINRGIDTGEIIVQKEVFFTSNETLKTSYETLKNKLWELFFMWWPRIWMGDCPQIPQTHRGTFHQLKDKEQLLFLMKHGWDTPVSVLEHYGKNIAKIKKQFKKSKKMVR